MKLSFCIHNEILVTFGNSKNRKSFLIYHLELSIKKIILLNWPRNVCNREHFRGRKKIICKSCVIGSWYLLVNCKLHILYFHYSLCGYECYDIADMKRKTKQNNIIFSLASHVIFSKIYSCCCCSCSPPFHLLKNLH